jgi:hypothetical protein
MSVGRDGYAYVLFVEGLLAFNCVDVFQVDIDTGECIEGTPFNCGTEGFNTFGMGYVTVSDTSSDEELYIGDANNPADLATLDVSNGQITWKGNLAAGGPEFTGNALGELWGFFPQTFPPRVAQIDKDSGAEMQTYPLDSLSSNANMWAFAFWGGDFYIFYKTFDDNSTNVYKLSDGELTTHIFDSGKFIVGAGVSTCAPVVIE